MKTCSSCWWREGDRCYFGNPEREENGKSKVFALNPCENHKGKRQILSNIFGPSVNLTIISEENAKSKGAFDNGNY